MTQQDWPDDSLSQASEISDISDISDTDDSPQSINIDLSNGWPLTDTDFKILHYNINSILADDRLTKLSDICSTANCSVLIITESKLNSSIPDNLLTIPGYHQPLRHDRPVNGRHGGGTLMYVSESLTYRHQTHLQADKFEHLWVDVKVKNQTYTINAMYRPPNESAESHAEFLTTTEQILTRLHDYKTDNKIIMSDLNFGSCFCKFPKLPHKPLDSSAPDLFQSFGYFQLLDIPTRVTHDTTSLLDLCFVHSIDHLSSHGTLPKLADHEGIFVTFHNNLTQTKLKTKTIYDYKNIDEKSLINYIKTFDFESVVFSQPVRLQADIMTTVLTDIFSMFVTTKQIKIKPDSVPWTNTYTRLLLRKKNRNYYIFKKIKSKFLSAEADRSLSNDDLTLLRNRMDKSHMKSVSASNRYSFADKKSKSAFFNTVNSTMNNCNISAKKKFSILTKLMKNNKISSIPQLIEDGQNVTDPKDKSDILNRHFSSKAQVDRPDDHPPVLPRLDTISTLTSLNTSHIEISKFIRTMKRSSFSHCGIPAKFLFLIATPISFQLSTLFNNMFSEGFFPDIFKIAHVTAIWKGVGLKSSKLQYRPISLLPTLSKICESVIHNRLLSHFIENNIISDRQAAYMKGDSTLNQLIYLVHTIRQAWSKGKVTQGLFLDVMGAFDKVWHSGLIAKLESVGVNDSCLDIFKSYLFNRKQVVVVDGVKSPSSEIKAGIPQGSRLGPLLFILYIEDIQKDLESEVLIFADDTTLLATADNPSLTSDILNRDITKIIDWSNKWKVTFNPSKSESVIFSSKSLSSSSPVLQNNISPHSSKNWFAPLVFSNTTPLLFNNCTVKRVDTHKHLGVYLSSTLDWSEQIHQVCLKANRKLAVLRSVKGLKRNTLDLLYKLTVRSLVDYALPLYFGTLRQSDIMKLDQIQYKSAKLVTGALHYTSKEKLNVELGWESFQQRYKILGLSLFRKVVTFQTRPLLLTLKPELTSPANTRQGAQYKPFAFHNVKMSNSFFPYFTKLWNNLDKSVKGESDINIFKDILKQQLKPTRYKHFNKGSQLGNRQLTRLRLNRNYLNDNSFSIGLNDTPYCSCNGTSRETTKHFFQDCTLHSEERQALIGRVSESLPAFGTFSKKKQLDIILNGFNIDSPDFFHVNVSLQLKVQTFVLKTKRFNN